MAELNPITAAATEASIVTVPADTPSSLQAVQEALAASTEQLGINRTKVQAGVAKSDSVGEAMVKAVGEISMADQIIQLTSENAKLAAQNATIEVFQASGGQNAQVARMQRLVEDSSRVEDLLNTRSDIVDDTPTGIGLIDSVINGFRTIQVDEEIAAARDERQQTTSEIANISAANESAAITNANTKKTLNSAAIAAGQTKIAEVASLAAGKLEIDNIHSNATAMATLAAADARNVDALIRVWQTEGEAATRELQAKQIEFEGEKLEAAKEALPREIKKAEVALASAELALADAQAMSPTRRAATELQFESAKNAHDLLLEERAAVVAQVQRGQSLFGLPVQDAASILWGLQQGGVIEQGYSKLYTSGIPKATASIGITPADSNNAMLIVDPDGAATRTKALDLLYTIRNQQDIIYAASPTGAPRDLETLNANFNLTAKQFIDPLRAEIKLGDSSNPFIAPPMATLAANNSVQRTALYQKVLKPMDMQETDHQRILKAALDGFISKTLTAEEAAEGVATLFKAAAAHNNTLEGGIARIGFEPQTTYNVSVATPSSVRDVLRTFSTLGLEGIASKFVGPGPSITSVDLMDLADVQQYIIRSAGIIPAGGPNADVIPAQAPAQVTPPVVSGD